MPGQLVTDLPRRNLSGRRPEMAARIVDAVPALVEQIGFEELTVRAVAREAGVSAATAYSYFGSKEHLLAELYWRRLAALPPVKVRAGTGVVKRLEAAVEPLALAVADEPRLAAAVTTSLLAHDPDVKTLREQIGDLMVQRLRDALGDDCSSEVLRAVNLMLAGALMNAGIGLMEYRSVPAVVARGAGLMVSGS